MIKASNPVVKDGLGILARLVVIAMLLSILSALLQGCTGSESLGVVSENFSGSAADQQLAFLKNAAQKLVDGFC